MRDLTRELTRLSLAIEQPNYLLPDDADAIRAVCDELQRLQSLTQPSEPTDTRYPVIGSYVLQFGQHKGQRIDDVPLKYLDWCMGQWWLSRQARMAIRSYLDDHAIAAELRKEMGE